jgi:hypothetical protein
MANGWIVPVLLSGSAAAPSFDPSIVAGLSRDWNFASIAGLWTDLGQETPVTADGDTIGSVESQVGGGSLGAPADDTRRPTYKTNIQNGLSVGRFDGSNDYLTNATAITADASQTIFIVAKKTTAASSDTRVLLAMNANASVFTDTDLIVGHAYYRDSGSNPVSLTGTPNAWNIIAIKYTSTASVSVYVNGGAANTFDPDDSYSTATLLSLGANSAAAQFGDYDIGRVLIYSAALSDADLNTVFSGLGTLWNITVTPVS